MEYVSPEYQRRLDELAELLMADRFIRSMGQTAHDGAQDVLPAFQNGEND